MSQWVSAIISPSRTDTNSIISPAPTPIPNPIRDRVRFGLRLGIIPNRNPNLTVKRKPNLA